LHYSLKKIPIKKKRFQQKNSNKKTPKKLQKNSKKTPKPPKILFPQHKLPSASSNQIIKLFLTLI